VKQLEELRFVDENGVSAVEGEAGHSFLTIMNDSRLIVEACYYHGVDAVLLYPENMPEGFFDLSSGQAGEILQKLRNYRIRLAIIGSVERDVRVSSRFGEMVAEERQGRDFGMFDTRDEALEWLRSRSS
jgi:hypothetical protein